MLFRSDRDRAARLGLNVGDIQDVIETALGGRASTMIWEGERKFAVVVRLANDKRSMANLPSTPILLPNGELGYYDKRHLFGFAGENEHYTAGTRRLVATVKGWRILLLVCYDLRFPVWSRQTADASQENPEPEYDLIIYVANWPERRSFAWKHLLPARAIENQCYLAAVNRVGDDGNGISHTGDSVVLDFMGQPLQTALPGEITLLEAGLDLEKLNNFREQFPFSTDADLFDLK